MTLIVVRESNPSDVEGGGTKLSGDVSTESEDTDSEAWKDGVSSS